MAGRFSKNPYSFKSVFSDGSTTSKVREIKLKCNNEDVDGWVCSHDSYKFEYLRLFMTLSNYYSSEDSLPITYEEFISDFFIIIFNLTSNNQQSKFKTFCNCFLKF